MHSIYYIAGSFFVMPLILILINNLIPKEVSGYARLVGAGIVAATQMVASVAGFFLLPFNQLHEYDFSLLWNLQAPGSEYFALTLLSLVMTFCIGMVSLVSVLIAVRTMDDKKTAYVNLLMTLILGMNGMVVVTDFFSLYVFLEIVGISSFVLIAMFHSRTGLEGALKYLVMSSLASIFILTGLSFLFMQIGGLGYAQVSAYALGEASGSRSILLDCAFILLIAGFSIKTGAVPFHSWLPDAHQSADSAVSVLLSGIVIKVAGIYGFIMLTSKFSSVSVIREAIAALGAVSILVGALFALRQTHFKRIVAYSSVSQMGYIMLGISAGTTLGMIGALLHIFNHAAMKCTLFSNAAALHEEAGTLEIDEMGGLQEKMPATGISSTAAFLSAAGIPPLAGFWSKLLIVLSLWTVHRQGYAIYAILASIMTAAYFLRLQKKVFFGKLSERYTDLHETGGTILTAEIALTVLMLAVGAVFPFALLYLHTRGIL